MDNTRSNYLGKLAAIFCICYPALWLYLPNIALIYLNPTFGWSLKSLGLLFTVLCTIPILLLPSKNLRQFWLWNLPFAAISACYTAYIIYYHDIPYDGMWFDLWNVSGEVITDLTKYFGHYFLFSVAGFILYCLCLFHPIQKQIVFSKSVKSYFLLASLSCLCVFTVITNFFSQKVAIQRVVDQSVVFQNYPYGMLGMMLKTAIAFSKGKHISIPPLTRGEIPKGREIFVFVIGEAERYDDWLKISKDMHSSLLTNPDIKIFHQAAGQANLTSIALPLLMSGTSTMQEALNHPLWMQFVKSTGCTTGWITNATEPFDYPYQNDFYDLNINRKAWVGISGVTYDDVLLPEIQRTLTQGPKKLCLVVHFIGSHFDYRLRYREDLSKFYVDNKAYDNFADPNHVTAFRNAYDNSIIQTNIVLQEILGMLAREDAISFLIYTSDHAESFDDGGSRQFFHGNPHPRRTEIQVPFFIWANAKFQQHYPAKWQALTDNQTRKISNIQVLPTFLDALSVSNMPAYLAPSLLQPYKNEVKQMVLLPSIELVPFESLP
jgi:glucan phosphoethanolaminetransferase (alkaline phosphatase superfamily)